MVDTKSHSFSNSVQLSECGYSELFLAPVPALVLYVFQIIVSTGSIRWILWFSVRYAAAAARREIFGVNALRGKQQQLGSPNLQDIFIGG